MPCYLIIPLFLMRRCSFLRFPGQPGWVALLHWAFLPILLGALLTAGLEQRGYVHLYPSEPVYSFVSSDGCTFPLPLEVRLDSFRIRLNRSTQQPTDYVSYLHLDGHPVRVSMNHVARCRHYRFCQTSYEEDGSSWLTVSHDPWGTGFTYAGYLCWGGAWVWLFHPRATFRRLWRQQVHSRGRRWSVVLVSLLLLLLLLLYIGRWYDGSRPLPPVLATPLLGVHVAFVMTAYMLLAVTFLVYAVPLHLRRLPALGRPLRYHLYMILAFLTVLMTWLGVNYLLGGLHSYAA